MSNQNQSPRITTQWPVTISWNADKLKRFKRCYHDAIAVSKLGLTTNTETFEFEGYTFVQGYAKYLIEYLEGTFKASV